jgi:hypothetical protein
MLFRHAVDGRRGDEDHALDAGLRGDGEQRQRPVDVDRADLLARAADRQRCRGVHEDPRAVDQLATSHFVANVPAKFLDGDSRLVERDEVERAHLVAVGEEPPREVQAEEARSAGDRPQHGGEANSSGRSCCGRGPNGG